MVDFGLTRNEFLLDFYEKNIFSKETHVRTRRIGPMWTSLCLAGILRMAHCVFLRTAPFRQSATWKLF